MVVVAIEISNFLQFLIAPVMTLSSLDIKTYGTIKEKNGSHFEETSNENVALSDKLRDVKEAKGTALVRTLSDLKNLVSPNFCIILIIIIVSMDEKLRYVPS